MGSWHRVIAGIAVVGVAASACQSSPARPPTVTMARLGPRAVGGVIGSGTINGKPWRFRLMSSPAWSAAHQCGPTAKFAADCAAGRDYLWHGLAGGAPVYFETIGQGVYGRVVDSKVNRLSAAFSDGTILDLRPVEATVRIVRSPKIVRWAVFDAAWTQVGGGTGPPDSP